MLAHARLHPSLTDMTETELFAKIQLQLVNRYDVDPNLASEMAWDLIEVLSTVDGDIDIFEKYFLHQ
jgi:hypothetical protein